MTHAMNDVLRRLLHRRSRPRWPGRSRGCWWRAARSPGPRPSRTARTTPTSGSPSARTASAFAGTKIDIGTRALLTALDAHEPGRRRRRSTSAAAPACSPPSLARRRPELRVLAVDQSAAAVASTAATAAGQRPGRADHRRPGRRRARRCPTAASTSSSAIRRSTSAPPSSPPRPTGCSPRPHACCAPAVSSGRSTTRRCGYKPDAGAARRAHAAGRPQTPKFTVTASTRR